MSIQQAGSFTLITENKVLDALAEAWNMYLTLQSQHPDEVNDFRKGINDLQRVIAMRKMQRISPSQFPIIPPKEQ